MIPCHAKRLQVDALFLERILRRGDLSQLETSTLVNLEPTAAFQHPRSNEIKLIFTRKSIQFFIWTIQSLVTVKEQIRHLQPTLIDDSSTTASVDAPMQILELLLYSSKHLTSLGVHRP